MSNPPHFCPGAIRRDWRLAEDFQTSRSPSPITRHLEFPGMLLAQISSAAHIQKVLSSLGKLDSTCMYHFQASMCADTESPDRNVTASALLHLECDISTSLALLPIPTGTGKDKLHSYSFAQSKWPVTILILIKPCLKSMEYHKLSLSSGTVSSPSLEKAVV